MGDVAMSVPVLRAFVAQNSDVKITFLSRSFLKPMFENISNVSFYTADVDGKHKGIAGIFKLYKELNKLNIDAVADIHNVLRSKILRSFFSFSFLPARRTEIVVIDKGRAEKKALTRTTNKIFKQLRSTHERYADVFRKLGFKVNLENVHFPKKEKIPESVKEIIGNDYKKLIGIAPFAQYNTKMYPLDLMEKVISKLSENNNYKILLFGGGAKEKEILLSFENKFKNTISLAGKIKLKEELIVISHLNCMVSMDSANSHLAAMQNVKTISIWGITHPYTGFYPFNQPMDYALIPNLQRFPNIPCSIYGNKTCEGYEDVMRSISPNQVIDKIESII